MAHPAQEQFCRSVKQRFPSLFVEKFVLDVGSLDINGNNQYLFDDCLYLGIDLAIGRNVDVVSKGHELSLPDQTFDLVISTECFEHDRYYDKTLRNMLRLLKPGGLFLFTCATKGRAEHGTLRTSAVDAPFLAEYGEWADYYKNLEESDIRSVLDVDKAFSSYEFSVNQTSHDIYFWGIKAGTLTVRADYSFQLKFASLRTELKERVAFIQSLQEIISAKEKLIKDRDKSIEGVLATVSERDCLIQQLMAEKRNDAQILSERDDIIKQLMEEKRNNAQVVDNLKTLLTAKDEEITRAMHRLNAVLSSRSWKLTSPLRAIAHKIRRI